MNTKKILFLDQFGDKFGGGQVILLDILEYFKKSKDWEIFVGLLGNGSFYEKVSQKNIALWKLPNIDSKKTGFWLIHFITFILKSCFTALTLIFKIKQNNIKLIYCNGGRTFLISIFLSIFFDVKIIWHLHLILSGEAKRFVEFFGRFQKITGIVAVSETVKKAYKDSPIYDKIEVLHNWVSPHFFPIPDHFKPIERPLKAATIGQVSSKKGQWFLLDVLDKLPKTLEFELSIVGDFFFHSEEETSLFVKKVEELNQKGWKIKILGFIDAIPEFLEKMDVLIIPSIVPESFGLTAIEAMSKGVIVLANSIGALPEIIEDSKTGFLFNNKDPNIFTQKLSNIIENKYPLESIRKTALEKINNEFSPEKQLKKVFRYIRYQNRSIYFDARLYNSSGIGTYIQNLIKNFEAKNDSPPIQYLVDTHLELNSNKSQSRNIKLQTPIYSLQEQFTCLSKTRSQQIFHAPHYNAPILYKGPLIVTIHDICHTVMKEFFKSFFKRAYAEQFLKKVLDRADAIITVSEFTKQEICRVFNTSKDRIKVIHNGVNTKIFKPADQKTVEQMKQKYSLPSEYILFLGNVRPHKNLSRLIQAYERLLNKTKETPPLVIVGELKKVFKEYTYLKELIGKLRLEKKIIFTGFLPQEDIPALYSGALTLVFPSLYEGFGFPALEAMGCGTPVITSNIASLPEIVSDAAYLVDPYSIDELENSMEEMISNSTLRDSLTQKGFDRVKKFRWEDSVQKHLNIYEQFL